MAKGYLQDVSWVDFYGRPIVTCYADDIGYVVPMKHIIEDHLGLDWNAAKKRMKSSTEIPGGSVRTPVDLVEFNLHNPGGSVRTPLDLVEVNLYNPVIVSGYDLSDGITAMDHEYPDDEIPQFSPNSEYLCLPIEELNMFLCSIQLSKVNPEVREQVYLYQKECMRALHDYWFRGFSVNTRQNPNRISSDRHEWCPREMSSNSLEKGCQRYAAFAQRQFESRINPEEIFSYVQSSICGILDIDSINWNNQESAAAFNLAFLERAAFDILYFSIERNVEPDDLSEVLDRNLINAWENMGTLILSIQSPYTPFPGVGRGAARELV